MAHYRKCKRYSTVIPGYAARVGRVSVSCTFGPPPAPRTTGTTDRSPVLRRLLDRWLLRRRLPAAQQREIVQQKPARADAEKLDGEEIEVSQRERG